MPYHMILVFFCLISHSTINSWFLHGVAYDVISFFVMAE